MCRSVKPLLTYGHLSIFQVGGRHHLGFSKCRNFIGLEGGRWLKCDTMPNCVAIGQTIAEIWPFVLFFKMAAAAVLNFQNVEILGVRRLKRSKMHHRAKFRVDRSNRCRDRAIFQFMV